MEKLRSKLLDSGVENIKKLADLLTEMDRDKDSVLTMDELSHGINKELGLEMSEEEVQNVFTELDKDGSKTLDLNEFFVAVRGCLSEAKLEVVMQAYHKLDKDGSGVIDMDDLKDGYDFKNARARSVMTNEEAANRFLLMFDKNNDKKVSKEEFLNYYAGMARLSDAKFVKMVKDTWKL
ncbi:crustacean calcium-binding protein 23-like [Asterias amurensis]|uniref:crustacean calcium-binding protein 23-like n=1 Tax=Asterias amurensis TaxID=7602 RepID=UPI003AB84090